MTCCHRGVYDVEFAMTDCCKSSDWTLILVQRSHKFMFSVYLDRSWQSLAARRTVSTCFSRVKVLSADATWTGAVNMSLSAVLRNLSVSVSLQCHFTSNTHLCSWAEMDTEMEGKAWMYKWHEALNAFTSHTEADQWSSVLSVPDFWNHVLKDLTLKPRILSYKHNITLIFCLIGNIFLCFVASE